MHTEGLSSPSGEPAHHQAGGDNRGTPPNPADPRPHRQRSRSDAAGQGAAGWEKELIPTPKSSLPASRL